MSAPEKTLFDHSVDVYCDNAIQSLLPLRSIYIHNSKCGDFAPHSVRRCLLDIVKFCTPKRRVEISLIGGEYMRVVRVL